MKIDRHLVLKNIGLSCQKYKVFENEDSVLFGGDCAEVLKTIPSESVSLILTDPPYHTTKKSNIMGDTSFATDEEYLRWMEQIAVEWRRIIKPNGSILCFCASDIEARLEMMFSKYFNVLTSIVWTKPNEPGFDGWKQKMKKEALRAWYHHSERVIFLEPMIDDNLNRSTFGHFLREARKSVNMSCNALAEVIGAYGKVNHGGSVANWEAGRNIPSRDQYDKIVVALTNAGYKKELPDYDDVIRPFNVNKDTEFTDVWTYPNIRPYKGKHPAEKPIKMLIDIINATTYEGDIVLDCFAGSGSTAVAALKLNRLSVSIELDEKWINQIKTILKDIEKNGYFPDNEEEPIYKTNKISLF